MPQATTAGSFLPLADRDAASAQGFCVVRLRRREEAKHVRHLLSIHPCQYFRNLTISIVRPIQLEQSL